MLPNIQNSKLCYYTDAYHDIPTVAIAKATQSQSYAHILDYTMSYISILASTMNNIMLTQDIVAFKYMYMYTQH
jgi:hypothetical protein